jgi:fumarate hydratase class I
MNTPSSAPIAFQFQPIFEDAHSSPGHQDHTEYRKIAGIDDNGVQTVHLGSETFLRVSYDAIRNLTRIAFDDVSHLLRTSHLEGLAKILKDPEASENDRFVATELIRNAVIAAERIFPSCQDTGTALAMAKRGSHVLTDGNDEAAIAHGVFEIFQQRNLRYSQLAPLSTYVEKNTGTNLPAQIDIYATAGNAYEFLFIAKGGGSANKSFLYQKNKTLLNPSSMESFVKEALSSLGTTACPPYHLALVIGGTSAEMNLKTVKLASCHYYDDLPQTGNALGRAFRDTELEGLVAQWARETGIGAQFGGKYFVHDVRVIRLPRHGASCPVGIGVSCSADRQIKAKITAEGVFLEQLETDPSRFLPTAVQERRSQSATTPTIETEAVKINLDQPMPDILQTLSANPVATRVMLNGPLIVARDIAHAKLKELLDQGKELPDYLKQYPIYYAGPAKTPTGFASGSFGPTTSQRMDPYVPLFQKHKASMVMLGKGNRTEQVTDSCREHGGFYLGSIGGPAARLGRDCIKKVEVIAFPELGMEAIWKIEVEDFPAFIIVDDKGNDFFKKAKNLLQKG